jgi:hypothetical protein
MAEPTHNLTGLTLKTVGFVDRGDNPTADIVIAKRADDKSVVAKGPVMDAIAAERRDALKNALAELQALSVDSVGAEELGKLLDKINSLSWRVRQDIEEAALAKNKSAGSGQGEQMADDKSKVKKAEGEAPKDPKDEEIAALKAQIAELQAKLPKEEPKQAPVSPDVQKRLDDIEKRARDAEAALASEVEKRELETFAKKAVEYGFTAEQAGLVRKVCKALTDDETKALFDVLKAQRTEVDRILGEKGKRSVGDNTEGAYAKLMKKARELRAAEKSLTIEQAYVRVSEDPENRELALAAMEE